MGILVPIVTKATAKEPANRYRSAREMAGALEAVKALLAGSSASRPLQTPVPTPARPSPVTTSWRVHQVAVSSIAGGVLWPLSLARAHDPAMTRVFFVAMGAAVFVIALRLNLLFLSFIDVAMLREQRRRWRYLLLAVDLLLCGALAAAAVLTSGRNLGFASLFGATSLGLLAAALVIEPTTTRTAFPDTPG